MPRITVWGSIGYPKPTRGSHVNWLGHARSGAPAVPAYSGPPWTMKLEGDISGTWLAVLAAKAACANALMGSWAVEFQPEIQSLWASLAPFSHSARSERVKVSRGVTRQVSWTKPAANWLATR